MNRKCLYSVRRLIRGCNSGTTIIEFALIAPVFFLIFMGIIEMGLIYFTQSVLDGALAHGARVGMTGSSVGRNRDAHILNEIARYTGGYLDASRIDVSIRSYTSFVNIGEPEPCIAPPVAPCSGIAGVNFVDVNGNGTWDDDQGRTGGGNANDVVLYRVEYDWSVITPLMSHIVGNNVEIVSTATVRNEAFDQ